MTTARGFKQLSLKAAVYERLTELAAERKVSRAKMVELLLGGTAGPTEVTRSRALELLASSAEAGSVPARVAYAREAAKLTGGAVVEPPDEFDELRERRRKDARS